MVNVKVTFNKISVVKILAVLVSCILVKSSSKQGTLSQRLLRRAKRSTCIRSNNPENFERTLPENFSKPNLQCKPGCHEVKVQVQYAIVKNETWVVGCRTKEFPSNAQRVYNIGQGYKWQCMKGYNPVIKEYPTTVEYEGDDKLVLKKVKGVLFGCEKQVECNPETPKLIVLNYLYN